MNDNYDSKDFEGTTGGLDVAFKNMIYDFYSRDFLRNKELLVHEETGQIVKEIFELVASGLSPLTVAKILNERGVRLRLNFSIRKDLLNNGVAMVLNVIGQMIESVA